MPYDKDIFDRLMQHGAFRTQFMYKMSSKGYVPGIDDLLSKHIAHLFIRDPLVVFSETIDQDDETSSDHFEVCAANVMVHYANASIVEYSVNKLADAAVQATATEFFNRLASRVSKYGGSDDRLRKCCVRGVRGSSLQSHSEL